MTWQAQGLLPSLDSPESAKRELEQVFEGFAFQAWLEDERVTRPLLGDGV